MTKPNRLIQLFVRGDVSAFHQACRDLEPEQLSLSGSTFRNLQLAGFDLSSFDLSSTEWENCTLSAMKWDRADLSGAYFNGCALVECSFEEANLDGCAIDGSVIQNTSLLNANLDATEMENTQVQSCTIDTCTLNEIAWIRVSFKGGVLSNLSNATGELKGIDLRDVTLNQVDLSSLSTSRCHHFGCKLEGSELPEGFSLKSGRRRAL